MPAWSSSEAGAPPVRVLTAWLRPRQVAQARLPEHLIDQVPQLYPSPGARDQRPKVMLDEL